MTSIQWYFHYLEVLQANEKKDKATMEYIELLTMFVNPELATKWREMKALKEAKEEITPESFPEVWANIKSQIPDIVTVRYLDAKAKDLLPTYQRPKKKEYKTPGIQINNSK